jgi:hypothetical protein
MKVYRARKNAKTKQQPESSEKPQTVLPEKRSSGCEAEGSSEKDKTCQVFISKPLSYHPSFISCACLFFFFFFLFKKMKVFNTATISEIVNWPAVIYNHAA